MTRRRAARWRRFANRFRRANFGVDVDTYDAWLMFPRHQRPRDGRELRQLWATAIAVVDLEEEEDGRWIGEVHALPGCLAYGATREEAKRSALALAQRIIAERIEHGEP